MAHVAIAIKNRDLNSLNDRGDICRMSERPNHVIIQDVLQGTCISFLRLQQQLSAQKQTTLNCQITTETSALEICYQYLHREKGKFRFTGST